MTNPKDATNALQAAPDLSELAAAGAHGVDGAMNLLYDVAMPVWIELGRTRMTVQEVLGLGRGSVIQLDRLVGEPVDLYVADRRFAEGEVVVLGEHFGVRVTRLLGRTAAAEPAS